MISHASFRGPGFCPIPHLVICLLAGGSLFYHSQADCRAPLLSEIASGRTTTICTLARFPTDNAFYSIPAERCVSTHRQAFPPVQGRMQYNLTSRKCAGSGMLQLPRALRNRWKRLHRQRLLHTCHRPTHGHSPCASCSPACRTSSEEKTASFWKSPLRT